MTRNAIKVFKVRGAIVDELDDLIDEGGSIPSYLEEIASTYSLGTKKYLDRHKKVVWIEHKGRAFRYKDCVKEYYQCMWEFHNSDDTYILPDRVVAALEIAANFGVKAIATSVNAALFKHYHSKQCRNIRRGALRNR